MLLHQRTRGGFEPLLVFILSNFTQLYWRNCVILYNNCNNSEKFFLYYGTSGGEYVAFGEAKVKSLAKALNVLSCFMIETPVLGVTELAERLGDVRPKHQPNTITDVEAICDELRRTRRRGYPADRHAQDARPDLLISYSEQPWKYIFI